MTTKTIETIKPRYIDDTTPKTIQLSYCAAERFKHIKALVDATPRNAPAPVTYGDIMFAFSYMANDPTASPAVRKIARRARRKTFSRLLRQEAKEAKK